MRFAICLIYFVFPPVLNAQIFLPEAKKEIDSYKKELNRLRDLYEKAVVKARSDLDLKLSTLAKKYADSGNTEKARQIDIEKKKLRLSNPLEKRLSLAKEITGKRYIFDDDSVIFKFESDGYIEVRDRGEKRRHPWVALSDSEVLYVSYSGTLGVIRFSDDRKNISQKIYFPQNKKFRNLDGSLMK